MYKIDLLVAGMPRSGSTLTSNLLTVPELNQMCLMEPGIRVEEYFPHTYDKIAIKEVNPSLYKRIYKNYNPDKIIVCLRDARDAAISLYQLWQRKERNISRSTDIIVSFSNMLCDWLDDLDRDVIYLKYEEFYKDDSGLAWLSDRIGWALLGNRNYGLCKANRENEMRGGIFITRKTEEDRKTYREIVDVVEEKCSRYQKRFCYD